jgi:MtN3 and saliva related transmembrane protein
MAPPAGSPVSLLGYGAAFLTTASFFPQAFKTLRGADVSGISLRTYGLLTLGVATWAVYGLLLQDGPLIAANLVTLVPASVVLQRRLALELQRRRPAAEPGRGPIRR